ncbi:hypothetical protein HYPSUDRAFT_219096 [Hypholoma sublateritium FD-334 SS-4]|uniref:Uncharacterized protein n=1 Tax=Hypholoma sublateritium (strain FD-334 SS-4) TaxID=945553 RepID=A0A0D2NKD1_HYPSF|nr:hypothetical protein HYPSUDRAFT_219096 [Hypholoma sublateritium FD-334 SS-4]
MSAGSMTDIDIEIRCKHRPNQTASLFTFRRRSNCPDHAPTLSRRPCTQIPSPDPRDLQAVPPHLISPHLALSNLRRPRKTRPALIPVRTLAHHPLMDMAAHPKTPQLILCMAQSSASHTWVIIRVQFLFLTSRISPRPAVAVHHDAKRPTEHRYVWPPPDARTPNPAQSVHPIPPLCIRPVRLLLIEKHTSRRPRWHPACRTRAPRATRVYVCCLTDSPAARRRRGDLVPERAPRLDVGAAYGGERASCLAADSANGSAATDGRLSTVVVAGFHLSG